MGQEDDESSALRDIVKRWIAAEPDADMVAELEQLLHAEPTVLADRFAGRLQFGTAGLRGPVGAGPLRMNRLVVRQAAAGLVDYLLATVPDARERGLLVGYDARRKSDVFALDTARVAAAQGMNVRLFDRLVPTPVLAWSITEVGAAAGVVVTASHNPPADNGYKVYLGDGSQIVAPTDTAISDHIDRFDPVDIDLAEADDALIARVGVELVDAYVRSIRAVRRRPDVGPVVVAYTALHGVGGDIVQRAFEASGLGSPLVVESQQQPDGTFPTVAFPNPEEPGAMDAVVALANERGAAVAIANDPDADRLGVAIPQPDGGWRRLAGDEIGWLLADHILAHGSGDDRLVVTTLVSSSMLATMAADYGVTAVETFTGFKWIAHEIREHPQHRFVFGYEQALGYLVTDRPRDKDGVSAAVLFAELVAAASADGVSVQARLDDLAARYGRHVPGEASVRLDPKVGVARVAQLVASPPDRIGGVAVEQVDEYPQANLLRFGLSNGVRVQLRPSGTEPKVKVYGEGVDIDPTPWVESLAALVAGA